MDRRDHLVAQLTHSEHDDGRFEVDVGRGAEHLPEAALHPSAKDRRHPRDLRERCGDVAQERLLAFGVGGPDRGFDQCPL